MTASRYMQKKFADAFDEGLQFWTSEDGDDCEWVIMRSADWRKWLDSASCGRWDTAATASTMREGFVRRAFMDRDYFDGPYPSDGPRKGWYLSDEETAFPVLVFMPVRLPRSNR